jgi:hypothetical protein
VGPARFITDPAAQLILETDYRPEQPFSFLCHALFLLLPVSPFFGPLSALF